MTESFTAYDVIATARSETQLQVFRDEFFVPGLDALIASMDVDAGLTDSARQSKFRFLVKLVTNRLQADDLFARHPEILDQPLGPLHVITGLPRGGTTKLHSLLSRHPDCHFLTTWQALQPVPLSADRAAIDDRRSMVAKYLAHRKSLAPTFDAIHEVSVDGPEEDGRLMQHSLHTMAFFDMYIGTYTDWLARQDLTNAYEDLRNWLKLLQWQDGSIGRPWMLKNVFHVNDLPTLRSVFPGTKVVWVHRQPRENIPSWCSLVHALRSPLSAHEDPTRTGAAELEFWSHAMVRGIAHRAELGERGFMDVHYADLLGDSRAVVERVLEFFGEESSVGTVERIVDWERDNPQHKHGQHRYSAKDFGLSADKIDSAFAGYVTRFALA